MCRRALTLMVSAFVLLGVALASSAPCAAEPAPKVVVTIKPIHSLAASLLAGVAEPVLLVEGQASSHTFALKPSAARAAHEADVLVRVSAAVEPFTQRLAANLPDSVELVTLATLPGLVLHRIRTGDTFEGHDHAHDHGASDHDDHPSETDGAMGRIDGHIWLDPANARRIATHLAEVFARRAPVHAERIRANAARLVARIDGLERDLTAELAPVRGRPFIVFHDAYQYLEHRFGLSASGAITLSPEVQPSARRLTALRRRLAAQGPVCVFAEPQFQGGVVASVVEGTAARQAVLDPEGALLEPGPDLYDTLMRRLATGMRDCLAALPAKR